MSRHGIRFRHPLPLRAVWALVLLAGCIELGDHTLSCETLPAEPGSPPRVQLALNAAAARRPGFVTLESRPLARTGQITLFLRGGSQRVRIGDPSGGVRCTVVGGHLSEGAILEVQTDRAVQVLAVGPAGDTLAGPIAVRPGATARVLRWRAR